MIKDVLILGITLAGVVTFGLFQAKGDDFVCTTDQDIQVCINVTNPSQMPDIRHNIKADNVKGN